MSRRIVQVMLILAGLAVAAAPARAVIMRLTPLGEVVSEGQLIFTAKVDRLDPDRPAVVLTVDEVLKGKAPFTRLPVNLTGDAEAKKNRHTPQLLRRLAPGLPLVVFVLKQDKQYIAFAYTNGTWLQMTAQDQGETPVWSFTHCEPYLRRTFAGTTADLRQTVEGVLSGKGKAPPPNPKEQPGLGPEVEDNTPAPGGKSELPWRPTDRTAARLALATPLLVPTLRVGTQVLDAPRPPLAVIPSVALGGLLSLLAMLFPAVFGGVTGQMKRWLAVISIASLNTTLIYVHGVFQSALAGTWWGTTTGLWVTLTAVTALGILWAWRRHLRSVVAAAAPAEAATPAPGEFRLLLILSLVGAVLMGVCWFLGYQVTDLPWSFVLALWIGIWVATVHAFFARPRTGQAASARPAALSAEGVILGVMVPACLALGLATAAPVGSAAIQAGSDRGAQYSGEVWTFSPESRGFIASSPLVTEDRVYTAVAHRNAFTSFGKLSALDRATGQVLWSFPDDSRMKMAFSSPRLADGRLYIGEGFHQDADCKLYCLDAASGKKLWEFATASHTESSPCAADGKVFIGAGDDGVYCLDAVTGAEVWHFQDNLHVDASPIVVHGRLYAGSGVGDLHKTLELFCLDAASGKPVWRAPSPLPAWGAPAVVGERVYFGLGNGNFLFSDERPAGGVMCVQAADGQRLWQADVKDGVVNVPVVDADAVYFGSRDGHVYAVARADGQPRWKRDLGSPVVAAPALAPAAKPGEAANSLYAVASGGMVACLNPRTGEPYWTFDLSQHEPQLLSSPAAVLQAVTPADQHRRIYFGAGIGGLPRLYCLEDHWTP